MVRAAGVPRLAGEGYEVLTRERRIVDRADERPWTPRWGKWVLRSLARRGENRQHSCQPPIRQISLRSSDHRGACRRGSPRIEKPLSAARAAFIRNALRSEQESALLALRANRRRACECQDRQFQAHQALSLWAATRPAAGRSRASRSGAPANLAGVPFVDDCTAALPLLLRMTEMTSMWTSM